MNLKLGFIVLIALTGAIVATLFLLNPPKQPTLDRIKYCENRYLRIYEDWHDAIVKAAKLEDIQAKLNLLETEDITLEIYFNSFPETETNACYHFK